ncbi:MAG: hypothetical protein ACK6EB_37930 [Planctomyces sp.]
MPAKFGKVAVNATTYTVLDATVNGTATVTFNNPAGINMRFAGEADAAPGAAVTTYTLIASNSAGVWTIECNPSKTWVRADTGGGDLQYHFNW